jgi:NADH-quinone oxidoreductase subunit C
MYTINNQLVNEVKETLTNKFGDAITCFEVVADMPQLTIRKDKITDVVDILLNTFGFSFLTDLCGVHYPESENELAVVYHLHNLAKNQRIRLKTFTKASDPSIPSITPLFSSANWMERETYDFYGIVFQGHPNLRRILNCDDMDYFPMRKEYALEDTTREDKDDTMFGR